MVNIMCKWLQGNREVATDIS
jgi:Zn-dependent protease